MDSVEFSILTEVCSVNYGELLSGIYGAYRRKSSVELLTLKEVLSHSDDDEDIKHVTKKRKRPPQPLDTRIINILSDYDFKCHFRVSKSVIEELIKIFEIKYSEKRFCGRPAMEISRMVLMGVWFLATTEPYRTLCDRFCLAIGHSNHTVRYFLCVMGSYRQKYIVWPNEKTVTDVRKEFNQQFDDPPLPGVMGAIACCQVKARRNKSRVFSFLVMQAVCSAKQRILDVFCGEADNSINLRVFELSELGRRMSTRAESLFPGDSYLVGDEMFPLMRHLLVPYSSEASHPAQPLQPHQRHFNRLLASNWSVAPLTLKALFGRLRRLGFLDLFKTDEIANAVRAACVLHNLCAQLGDPTPEYSESVTFTSRDGLPLMDSEEEGVAARDTLAAQSVHQYCLIYSRLID